MGMNITREYMRTDATCLKNERVWRYLIFISKMVSELYDRDCMQSKL